MGKKPSLRSLATPLVFMAAAIGFGCAQNKPALITASTTGSNNVSSDRALYLDPAQAVDARVEDLLPRLTLDEKFAMIHADSKFTTSAIPRLGIPRRWLSDGPNGVREDVGPDNWDPSGRTDDFSTWLPINLELAATWNPRLAFAYGQVIGQEAVRRGKDIMLGPSLNIQRTPLCGRNFEYMGEDPLLTGRMAVQFIKGEQGEGISACAKHFAANNQETNRGIVDVDMDERTLREIYLPAFKAAVQEGGVWCVMGAYNCFRGQHCCHNDYLLNTILKGEWGFQGLVVSDWGGVHDTRQAAMNGLDLEMGTEKPYDNYYMADPLKKLVKDGTVPMAVLDDKVRRNLRVMIATRALNVGPTTRGSGSLNTSEHQLTARNVAEEGTVLLKNEGELLPLDSKKIKSIAVIGEDATRKMAHGGGSAMIKAFYEITPLEGIVGRVGDSVNVTYSEGYSEKTHAPAQIDLAVQAAKQADVAIIFAGLGHDRRHDTEGSDRLNLKLPYGQDDLIAAVTRANPKTIVVLIDGGAVEMPWIDSAPAILQGWYAGMEGGNALAAVLFGDVNPSGKLPCTFPKQLADSPAHALHAYPGKNGKEYYQEGLLVGYRWFDTRNIEPLFPFGYGLSYTTFKYSSLELIAGGQSGDPMLTVQCNIANTGLRDGAEVVQVYVHQTNPTLPRPDKELKGFAKVSIPAGEERSVSIPLDVSSFSYYDPARGWVADKDAFTIEVGSSSRDIRLKGDWSNPEQIITKELADR